MGLATPFMLPVRVRLRIHVVIATKRWPFHISMFASNRLQRDGSPARPVINAPRQLAACRQIRLQHRIQERRRTSHVEVFIVATFVIILHAPSTWKAFALIPWYIRHSIWTRCPWWLHVFLWRKERVANVGA